MERLKIEINKHLNNYDLNVKLESGASRIGILGESGAGKSMTLKCIAGIEKPDSGQISIDGVMVYDSGSRINRKPQDRHAGYLFQNYALFPTMTVYENVASGTFKNNPEIKEIMRRFKIDNLADVYPDKLSGGQKQRVALARILISRPRVIMLDEPFSALDATMRDRMQQELVEYLGDYDGIVVMVSHDRDEIYRFSDEIYIISEGSIIEGGRTEDVFLKPKYKETARLTGCKNITELKRIDDYHADAEKWGLSIKTERKIPEYAKYLGYRAHDFAPMTIDDSGNNTVEVSLNNISHLPFESRLYYTVSGTEEPISYFVDRDEYARLSVEGLPEVLGLKEDKMLFLR